MLGWIGYQIDLRRAQAFREKLEREYKSELRRLYERKTNSDDIQEFKQVHWMDLEIAINDVQYVVTKRLVRLADKHFISLPPYGDEESWDATKLNGRVLTQAAVRRLRAEIRKEQQEDQALLVQWATVVTGLLGAATGLAAVLLG